MGSENLCYIRNLSEDEAVNLDCVAAESPFKSANGGYLMLRNGLKLRRRCCQAFDLPEVFQLIGCNPNGAPRGEPAMERFEKAFGRYSARGVTALRPGIGKQQMKHGDGACRQKMLNRVGQFTP